MSEILVDDPAPPPSPYRNRRRIALLLVLSLVAALGYGGSVLYSRAFGVADYAGAGDGKVIAQVQPGDSAADIGASLVELSVVKSVKAFTSAARLDERARGIQPGYYQLKLKMSGAAALALMLDPDSRVRGRVTLPEGFPLSKVISRLERDTELTRAAIVAALGNPTVLGLPSWAGPHPEGFLFPATYDIEPGSGAVDALQQMTQKFGDVAAELDLLNRAQALGLKPYEVVIIASLVEAETPLDADRPKVARVVLNRLARGMPLQFDSTINYVRAERRARLTLDDLKVESPYNSYRNKGLPPTPINSPGERALEAALTPAAGNWIYFITIDKAGNSLFTNDYQEFLDAKAKAKRENVY